MLSTRGKSRVAFQEAPLNNTVLLFTQSSCPTLCQLLDINYRGFIGNTTSGVLELYTAQCSKNGERPGVRSIPNKYKHPIIQIYFRMTADIPTAPWTQNEWFGSTFSVAVWSTGCLVPIRVSIELGRGSRSNRRMPRTRIIERRGYMDICSIYI